MSIFTAETHIRHLDEVRVNEPVYTPTQVFMGQGTMASAEPSDRRGVSSRALWAVDNVVIYTAATILRESPYERSRAC